MYTGSIPVLASNKINDLRLPFSPLPPFLKQPLELSRFGLASYHLNSCLLSTLRKLPLPDRPALLFEHLNAGVTGDGFDHLIIASSQIKLDRRVFSEPMDFVVSKNQHLKIPVCPLPRAS